MIRAQLGLYIVMFLLLALSYVLAFRGDLVVGIAVFALVFGLGALLTWMFFRNASVEGDGSGAIVKRSWTGSSRSFDGADVDSSVYALQVAEGSGPARPTLLLMDKAGSALLLLRGYYWDRASLELMIGAIGITPNFVPHRVSPKDLRAVHPRAISWPEANRVLFALILVGSILLVGTIIVVVVFVSLIGAIPR